MTSAIRRDTAGITAGSDAAGGDYVERGAALTVLLALAVGCVLVLRPFLSGLLLAVILVVSTWPLYCRVDNLLNDRRSLAAFMMTVAIALVLLVPVVAVGLHLAENAGDIAERFRSALAAGLPPLPEWIGRLPIVGAKVQAGWRAVQFDSDGLAAAVQPYIAPARDWVIASGGTLLEGMLQLSVGLFVAFFLYRDGPATADTLSGIVARLSGRRAEHLVRVAASTINGVVRGVLGTALIQAILMAAAFRLAGVPAALFLGFISFFATLIPMGLIVLWLPAAIWVAHRQSIGWAIFVCVSGLIIGAIENWLRPLLIVKHSEGGLPLALVLLGILGGLLSFGFLGIFIGPVLLAVGCSLVREWATTRASYGEA